MGAGRRRNWTQEHEIERLMQLRADIDSAWGRYITECLRMGLVKAPADTQAEWMRRTEQAETQRECMLRDCDTWLTGAANANGG
jgi:hypothetical protein